MARHVIDTHFEPSFLEVHGISAGSYGEERWREAQQRQAAIVSRLRNRIGANALALQPVAASAAAVARAVASGTIGVGGAASALALAAPPPPTTPASAPPATTRSDRMAEKAASMQAEGGGGGCGGGGGGGGGGGRSGMPPKTPGTKRKPLGQMGNMPHTPLPAASPFVSFR